MTVQDYVNKELSLPYVNTVKDIIDYHGIEITYSDQLNKNSDSCLVMCDNQAYITLKTGLNPIYENFLLAHELGHYVLHHDNNISFYFLLRTKKNALEREANEFACRLLLNDVNFHEVDNMEFIIKEKGIPLEIWYTINDVTHDFF